MHRLSIDFIRSVDFVYFLFKYMKNVILTRVGGHISWVLAGVWLAWMIADLLDATISYQVSRYASTIDVYGFGDTLPWPRWVVEIAGLAILILRREDPERTWPLMVCNV